VKRLKHVTNLPAPNIAEFTLAERQVVAMQRRTAVRYRCAVGTLGQLSIPGSSKNRDIVVCNLSETGIGLSLEQPLDVGTHVVIRMRGPASDNVISLPSRVVQVSPDGADSWRAGCAFEARLMPETLLALLAEPQSWITTE
jgi:PilZ domain